MTLCQAPPGVRQLLPVDDVLLYPGWNLISAPIVPYDPDITVVQRPIAGRYFVIQSFDQGARSFYPDLDPDFNTLHTFDGEHGYWVKVTAQAAALDEGELESAATWRISGPELPITHPLPLAPGWNLVSYLPRASLPVTVALHSIEGGYTAVLGFDQGARSFYPDLEPGFNTLQELKPHHGYWIRATEAITLTYPITDVSGSALRTLHAQNRPSEISGLRYPASRATNVWVDFYGETDAAPGAVIQAIDPDGVVCGATVVSIPGQFGLLPCYGDDPDTPEDEGAQPGDVIRLLAGEEVVGLGLWAGPGERWRVTPGDAAPGAARSIFLPLMIRRGAHAAVPLPTPTPESVPTPEPENVPLYLPFILARPVAAQERAAPASPTAAPTPPPESLPAPSPAAHQQWLPIYLEDTQP